MTVSDEIERKLRQAFAPEALEILNESAQHAGHAGHDGSDESHFRVLLRAPAFAQMSRIERHRAVHKALGPELTGHIHALALDIAG